MCDLPLHHSVAFLSALRMWAKSSKTQTEVCGIKSWNFKRNFEVIN